MLSTVENYNFLGAGAIGYPSPQADFTTKAMLALGEIFSREQGKVGRKVGRGVGEAAVAGLRLQADSGTNSKRRFGTSLSRNWRNRLINGMAGTGKTFMLDATRSTLELSGYNVIGAAALSGKGGKGLQEGARIEVLPPLPVSSTKLGRNPPL